MGVNNKARRAAKRRNRGARQAGPSAATQYGGEWAGDSAAGTEDHGYDWQFAGSYGYPRGSSRDERPSAEWARRVVLAALVGMDPEPAAAPGCVDRLLRTLPGPELAAGLTALLTQLVEAAVNGCWTPADLGEITRRRLTGGHLPLLALFVGSETRRHPAATVRPSWRAELEALGEPEQADLSDRDVLVRSLQLAWLLGQLPELAETTPPPGSSRRGFGDAATGAAGASGKVLARVRALLAKAESSDFPEEAEALSAKAQELIASYSLERLLEQRDAPGPAGETCVRRVWIEAPYVAAKGMLAGAVAGANHCRSVLSEGLGFVTLVGRPADVAATELLTTSLLVQASRAMLREGRGAATPAAARSRTPSYRRSFLIAYATRIGERLARAAGDSLAASAHSAELVPVLARTDERVRAATEQIFPHIVSRAVRVSNAMGWAAGQAAADLALFDVRSAIADQEATG